MTTSPCHFLLHYPPPFKIDSALLSSIPTTHREMSAIAIKNAILEVNQTDEIDALESLKSVLADKIRDLKKQRTQERRDAKKAAADAEKQQKKNEREAAAAQKKIDADALKEEKKIEREAELAKKAALRKVLTGVAKRAPSSPKKLLKNVRDNLAADKKAVAKAQKEQERTLKSLQAAAAKHAKAQIKADNKALKDAEKEAKKLANKGKPKNAGFQLYSAFWTKDIIDPDELEVYDHKRDWNKATYDELTEEQKNDPEQPWNKPKEEWPALRAEVAYQ